jgi:hypothetical protein
MIDTTSARGFDFREHINHPYILKTVSADALAATVFEPITRIVPGYIVEGLTLLAGKPKAGKSYLALNIAYAIATGGQVLGAGVEQGDVLYLALEDNERRLQRRLDQIEPFRDKPSRLHFATQCNRLDKGGLEAIESWCKSVKKPRCVIVDVFGKVRAEKRRDESRYDYDYRTMVPLKDLADEFGIAVIVIHHLNKRQDIDDPLDAVSSTTGLTGAADSILILANGPQGPTLIGKGRDLEDIETALRFNHARGLWTALGDATEVRRTDERNVILEALLEAEPVTLPITSPATSKCNPADQSTGYFEPMSVTSIAEATGLKSTNIRVLLGKMVKAGEVCKAKRGRYHHPLRPPVTSVT